MLALREKPLYDKGRDVLLFGFEDLLFDHRLQTGQRCVYHRSETCARYPWALVIGASLKTKRLFLPARLRSTRPAFCRTRRCFVTPCRVCPRPSESSTIDCA